MTIHQPRISIITPSFNQADFIEATICSVIGQGYPNLEYIIIDGGSKDGSVDIIKRYEKYITYWVSERDRGQVDAINKGMKRATGDIIAYLNSDDYYLDSALRRIADFALSHPDIDLIHGTCRFVTEQGAVCGARTGDIATVEDVLDLWDVWWKERNFVQPEVFWTRRIAEKVGLFREDLYWVMDYEYWLRILLAGGRVGRLAAEVAAFRIHPNQKSTQPERTAGELLQVVEPWIFSTVPCLSRHKRRELKAKWLYHAGFLTEAAQSVTLQEGPLRRWARLGLYAMRHPRLFMLPEFRRRLASPLSVANPAGGHR